MLPDNKCFTVFKRASQKFPPADLPWHSQWLHNIACYCSFFFKCTYKYIVAISWGRNKACLPFFKWVYKPIPGIEAHSSINDTYVNKAHIVSLFINNSRPVPFGWISISGSYPLYLKVWPFQLEKAHFRNECTLIGHTRACNISNCFD